MNDNQQNPPETSLSIPSGPYSVRALMRLNEDTPITECPHNVDLSTHEGCSLLFNMAARPEGEIEPGRPVRMLLRHYLLIPDEVPGPEEGEVVPVIRTILTDGNGRFINSTSEVLPKRLKQLLLISRQDSLRAGIPIEVFSRASKQPGRRYHDIRILEPGENVDREDG